MELAEKGYKADFPACAIGNYDQFVHKTQEDYVWLAQHELDLHEEGERRLHHLQVKQLRAYIKKYKA